MKILWINPYFLDYRVPVYKELNDLTDNNLYVVYSEGETTTPKRVSDKLKEEIGTNAHPLTGSKTYVLGNNDTNQSNSLANKFIKINYQPNLLKTVLSYDVDVIIVEGFFQWSPTGYIKKIFGHAPLVLSYERTFHTERSAPKWREFYRKVISKVFVNSAVVNGKLSKEYTSYLGVRKNNIITGGMAADSQFFRKAIEELKKEEVRKKWNFDSKELIFICVGRLIERKGIMPLLKAWNSFHGENAVLVFAGDGELKENVEEYIKENNLTNVRLLGSVEYSQIPSLYMASDVFLSSTIEDNWSLVVPEAMACGLPIACSKYNGCWPELVHDDINGKVFDPLDKQNTLEMLEYFYKNKDRLKKMGEQSDSIEKNYTPKNAAKAIYKACEIAMEG